MFVVVILFQHLKNFVSIILVQKINVILDLIQILKNIECRNRKNQYQPISISTVLNIIVNQTSDTSSEYDTADDGSPGSKDPQNVNPGPNTQIPKSEILPNQNMEKWNFIET
ncbi:hypothetical protein Glove_30g16 [Diversispora epigaea]|uniref:Uncharacterized protein n=1 Tax=Diversispora epigaea TaxID=1348612 RepID=A0A397JIF2_9GLOM|nr:hypothetical protein Glove_30g16 [Diversispora epigaea]